MLRTRGQTRNVEGRKDISNGKEKHPIPVLCPDDILLPQFEYIIKHSTSSAFIIPADRLERVMKGCQCEDGKCNSKLCGCYKYSSENNEIIECGDNCYCSSDKCKNRKFSKAIPPGMYLKYGLSSHGFGVYANEDIPNGTIVASYVGEISEIQRHTQILDSDYTWSIEKSQSKISNSEIEIDATKKGNIARFFNHSCKSNLMCKIVYYGMYRMPYPTFIAKRKVKKNDELTISYGKNYFSMKGIPCKCGECDGTVL